MALPFPFQREDYGLRRKARPTRRAFLFLVAIYRWAPWINQSSTNARSKVSIDQITSFPLVPDEPELPGERGVGQSLNPSDRHPFSFAREIADPARFHALVREDFQ
jgi:hypothetical protein